MNADRLRLETATAEDFSSLIGQEFALALEEGEQPVASLKLTESTATQYTSPNGRTGFVLCFEGPPDVYLEQHIYWLSNSVTGDLGIFLVPISEDESCRRYQAVFN
ncbi:MAG: hypothetical protein KF784_15770 [Fimbriimonadaceae bacterium]|nr:hypothetical protein [Fimbriimonadaceae bacterium]